jgi:hypothetical protein
MYSAEKSVAISEENVASIFSLLWLPPASCSFLAWFILQHWTGRRRVPPRGRLNFNDLLGVIPQKTGLCITTAVRTSNLNSLLVSHTARTQNPIHCTNYHKQVFFWRGMQVADHHLRISVCFQISYRTTGSEQNRVTIQ